MIASVSRSIRHRLFPICRFKRCRSVATVGNPPTACQKCHAWALSLTDNRPLTMADALVRRKQRRSVTGGIPI